MDERIDRGLQLGGGAASRAQLVHLLGRARLDQEVRGGRLVAPFARAYCRPWDVDQPDVRDRAALLSIGWPVLLSHTSALRRWGLLEEEPDAAVHVTTTSRRCPRPQPGLVPHRVLRLPRYHPVGLLRVVEPATAVVTSWPLVPLVDRRAPAITATRTGLVTPDELRAELARHGRLPGRSMLAQLLELLAAGCESELEIWGHLHVFDAPGLDHARPQCWVRTPRGRVRADLGYEAEKVAIEMDGWRWHSGKEQRERDQRKDTALASAGWISLRFSHERLHADVDGCRQDTLATLAARRR